MYLYIYMYIRIFAYACIYIYCFYIMCHGYDSFVIYIIIYIHVYIGSMVKRLLGQIGQMYSSDQKDSGTVPKIRGLLASGKLTVCELENHHFQ